FLRPRLSRSRYARDRLHALGAPRGRGMGRRRLPYGFLQPGCGLVRLPECTAGPAERCFDSDVLADRGPPLQAARAAPLPIRLRARQPRSRRGRASHRPQQRPHDRAASGELVRRGLLASLAATAAIASCKASVTAPVALEEPVRVKYLIGGTSFAAQFYSGEM